MDSTAGASLLTYCPGRQTKANARRRRKAIWLLETLTSISPNIVITACTAS